MNALPRFIPEKQVISSEDLPKDGRVR